MLFGLYNGINLDAEQIHQQLMRVRKTKHNDIYLYFENIHKSSMTTKSIYMNVYKEILNNDTTERQRMIKDGICSFEIKEDIISNIWLLENTIICIFDKLQNNIYN